MVGEGPAEARLLGDGGPVGDVGDVAEAGLPSESTVSTSDGAVLSLRLDASVSDSSMACRCNMTSSPSLER